MAKSYHVPSIEEIKALLKSKGLKATRQRLAVHEAMIALGHASADMVTEYISANGGPKVTVASVYNVLAQFALYGFYRHRLSANNKMYFDVNTSRHMHLYDTYNNEFRDIVDEDILRVCEDRLKHLRFKGYKIDGIDVQVICHPTHRKTSSSS